METVVSPPVEGGKKRVPMSSVTRSMFYLLVAYVVMCVFESRGSKFFNRAELGQYLAPDVNDRHHRRRYDHGDHSRGDRFECWFYGGFLWGLVGDDDCAMEDSIAV